VMLQNSALTNFEAALATDTAAQGNAYAALGTDMRDVGFDVTATTADLASFGNTLKAQGLAALPQEEQAIIKTFLPNVADQQAILAQMTSVSQSSVPLSFTGALDMGSSTLQSVATGLTVPPLTDNTVPPLSGSGPFANLPAGNNFSITDTSTAQSATTAGTPYSGPLTTLQTQLVVITSDNLNITATSPNAFIHSGSGNDALNVSKANGNNVLDGGTGSNFLTGGTGADTFFVDDRGPPADIWSTVVNFHSGDAATIWGVTPQDFALNWVDGQGAAGFTGLTLHATAPGISTASLTLAGFTQADMASGKLAVSFGSDPVSGSAYMLIHGNA
jgi:Ca2+-binding RTX toxin-like protein